MEKGMSNASGASTGSSIARARGRVFGVPRRCPCGEQIVELISKSTNNPFRRYFRCRFAVAEKLTHDNHTFKWVDEAHLDEIEALKANNARLEAKLAALAAENEELRRQLFENVQLKLENEILETVEKALLESATKTKKMMIVVVVSCMVMIGCTKIVG